jgi:hypothetical protein
MEEEVIEISERCDLYTYEGMKDIEDLKQPRRACNYHLSGILILFRSRECALHTYQAQVKTIVALSQI